MSNISIYRISDLYNLFLILIFSLLDLRLFRSQEKKNSIILFISLVLFGFGKLISILSLIFFERISYLSYLMILLSFVLLLYFSFRKYAQFRKDHVYRRYHVLQLIFLMIIVSIFLMKVFGIVLRYDLICFALLIGCNTLYFFDYSEKLYKKNNEEKTYESISIDERLSSHFIYNTLMSIEEICEEDGKRAAEAIEEFADYLKGNIKGLSADDLIPFDTELKHIRTYVSLQEKAMRRMMDIRYDLKITDFLLPPLCIQPLVENAFKYGDKRQGNIVIRTFEEIDDIYIVVEDLCSMNVENLRDDRKQLGIALKTIEERLKTKVDGRFLFEREGDKVIATVILPKKEVLS